MLNKKSNGRKGYQGIRISGFGDWDIRRLGKAQYPNPPISKSQSPNIPITSRSFTLLEVLIALAIFTVVMTMVLMTVAGSFKSLRQAQTFMLKEQKQRMCLYNLGKEVSSFTKIDHPMTRFEGENSSFFLSMPKKMILLKPDTFIMPQEIPLSGIQKSQLIMTAAATR
jgi:hypothetical protein